MAKLILQAVHIDSIFAELGTFVASVRYSVTREDVQK